MLTEHQAQMWLRERPVNPLTNRRLKINGKRYNNLNQIAYRVLGVRGGELPSTCQKTWVSLSNDEADEYGKTVMIPCPCGEWQHLNVVHRPYGGYYCVRCDGSVDLVYFCFNCKNSGDAS